MPLSVGQRFGPYSIEERIGAGGMGEVYKALDTRLGRVVAIKVLSPGVADDSASRQRFEREARTISGVEHPNICALYDVGETDGRAYLVMQYLEGETLDARLTRGPLPRAKVLRIAVEICGALEAAHRHSVAHRDVKPSNIMLTANGAKLLDFGLATDVAKSAAVKGASLAERLTQEGTIVGTLHYMAPEQIRGEGADARSDVYGFGAVLYEMLAGRAPFEASDPASLIGAILTRTPTPLELGDALGSRLERVVRTCLEKEPSDRWQSAHDLGRELQWLLDEESGGGVISGGTTVGAATAASAWSGRRAFVGTVAAVLVTIVASWALWAAKPAALPERPVVVMMDSPHPQRVYDPATLRASGTNADDLTDVLGGNALTLVKENTGNTWHREDQILSQDPDLILVHRSCFFDATLLGDAALDEKFFPQIYPTAADKFEVFMGYMALGNPRVRFVVYSRGSWQSDEEARAWVAAQESRFPRLKGRLVAYRVPLTRATFRNAETAAEIRALALGQLREMGRLEE